jgi:hypothetical protein
MTTVSSDAGANTGAFFANVPRRFFKHLVNVASAAALGGPSAPQTVAGVIYRGAAH